MDNSVEHSLGHRAFFLFLFKRIKFALFLFGLTWALWYGERFVTGEYSLWADYATKLTFLLSVTYLILVVLRTYLEYRRYTYSFTEDAFIMTQGYMVRNEIGAVYHQIQSVNIKRTPLDRLIGVSQLIIILTGTERETHHPHIILPGVGKSQAKLVQKELLNRARKQAMAQVHVA